MVSNKKSIEQGLIDNIDGEIQQQYFLYKDKVAELQKQYNKIKKKRQEIIKIINEMKNENIIDEHLSKLLALVKEQKFKRRYNNDKNIKEIIKYFQEIQDLTVESLKTIFEIRQFFTGQDFDIYIENEGKIFSFSIKDIERHSGNVIPIYTDSLEKFIDKLAKDSKTTLPEFSKLGLTLKNLSDDLELKNIQSYLKFVDTHVKRNKVIISENRKLEAAIYLYGRNEKANFSKKSDRHSLHIMLGWYIAKGGIKDNITMYKLGDAIRETKKGFKNIEIKMHNGTISLNMVANGIKKLNEAFNSDEVQEKIIKFFGVSKNKLSSPIERAAEKDARQAIEAMFKQIKV